MIRFFFAAVLASALSAGAAAHAQSYPNRTIKLLVPFPAGGATDNAARLVAQRLQGSLGQSVIIENQGGAGGTIGTRQAAGAAPDGYTLLMASIGTFGSMPLLYKLDFDPQRTFAPVATVVIEKGALVAGPSLAVKTIGELVAYAKAHPGKLTYGSAIGIGPHFVAELFKIKSGTDIVHIPYRGGAPMVADLVAGQIDMTVNGKSVLLPQIQVGKLRALAVTARRALVRASRRSDAGRGGIYGRAIRHRVRRARARRHAGGGDRKAQCHHQPGTAVAGDARASGEDRHRADHHDAAGVRRHHRPRGPEMGSDRQGHRGQGRGVKALRRIVENRA